MWYSGDGTDVIDSIEMARYAAEADKRGYQFETFTDGDADLFDRIEITWNKYQDAPCVYTWKEEPTND